MKDWSLLDVDVSLMLGPVTAASSAAVPEKIWTALAHLLFRRQRLQPLDHPMIVQKKKSKKWWHREIAQVCGDCHKLSELHMSKYSLFGLTTKDKSSNQCKPMIILKFSIWQNYHHRSHILKPVKNLPERRLFDFTASACLSAQK